MLGRHIYGIRSALWNLTLLIAIKNALGQLHIYIADKGAMLDQHIELNRTNVTKNSVGNWFI